MQKSENLQLNLITNSMDDAAMTFLEYRDKVSGASDDSNMQIIDRAFGEISADMEAASEPLEKADQLPYEKHAVTGNTVTLTGLYDSANITKLKVTLEPTSDGSGSFMYVSNQGSSNTVIYGSNPSSRATLVPNAYATDPMLVPFDGDNGSIYVTITKITACEIDFINHTFTPTWGLIENYPGTYDFPGQWVSSADSYSAGTRPSAGANVAFEIPSPRTYNMGTAAMSGLSFSSGAQQLSIIKNGGNDYTALAGFTIEAEYWADGYKQQIKTLEDYLPAIQAYQRDYFVSHFWGFDNISQKRFTVDSVTGNRLRNIVTLSGSIAQADTDNGVFRLAISYQVGKCNEFNRGDAVIDPVIEGDSSGKYYIKFETIGGSVSGNPTITLYATSYSGGRTNALCTVGNSKVVDGDALANHFLCVAINIGSQESVSFSGNYRLKITITRVDGLADLIS